jgi:hypothetical protein
MRNAGLGASEERVAQIVPFIHWHNVERRGRAKLLESAAAGGIHYQHTAVLQKVLQRQLKRVLQTELHESGVLQPTTLHLFELAIEMVTLVKPVRLASQPC